MKKVLCLNYPSTVVGQPVVYRLVNQFHLTVNILRARVEPNEGWLEIEVEGPKSKIATAIAWLTAEGLEVSEPGASHSHA
jgi:ABC-type methionine transport system ATPase subunit